MSTEYHVYGNAGTGGPVDYTTVLATVTGLTWTSSPLTAGTWKFGVRAFDSVTGFEESNVDAVVTIVVSAGFADVTSTPLPPQGLTGRPIANAGIEAAWAYPFSARQAVIPTGFHVYVGTGGTPNYSSPAATVPFGNTGTPIALTGAGSLNYRADLAGLTNGTTYTLGVRAYFTSGSNTFEEQNTVTVNVTADSMPPANVDDLAAT